VHFSSHQSSLYFILLDHAKLTPQLKYYIIKIKLKTKFFHPVMMFALAIIFFIFFPLTAAKAVCPICTVAVCASVGLSRWLGVDDTITGQWIGGLAVSLIIWTVDYLNKKNIRFYGRKILTVVFYYLIIIWPLYYFSLVGHPYNRLWGMDKLILGIIIGSIFFSLAVVAEYFLKKKNDGKTYFPFQKVVFPVGFLLIGSLIFYSICYFHLL